MRRILFIALIAVTLAVPNLFAQRGGRAAEVLEVKLASPLPKESPWGRTLDEIAVEWNRITNGQVRLSIRHGGIEGSEEKMLLSMASDTIQAGVFTSFGLSAINPAVMTISAPFLIRTEAELSAVMREVEKDLEAKMNNSNYLLVAWSKAGFVNIFSKDPVYTPDDLRKQRIATNPEAAEMNAAFKSMGFQIVEAEWTDLGTKLNAGTVMASYLNPAAVAAYQLHTMMKNMLSTNIAPVMGGIVINQVTWRKIGELNPKYQQDLLTATRRIADRFDASLQKTVNDAVTTMTRGGMKVNRPTTAQEQLWYQEIEKAIPSLLGSVFDRELYNKISAVVTRMRGGR
jgi:TRAP-type C4-dicarboxylate transport system substrate-binding protein